jgi:hypothetical protein
VAVIGAAQQEIRVRSGRDENLVFVQNLMVCLAYKMTHWHLSLTLCHTDWNGPSVWLTLLPYDGGPGFDQGGTMPFMRA